jgi:hypothetical protein
MRCITCILIVSFYVVLQFQNLKAHKKSIIEKNVVVSLEQLRVEEVENEETNLDGTGLLLGDLNIFFQMSSC